MHWITFFLRIITFYPLWTNDVNASSQSHLNPSRSMYSLFKRGQEEVTASEKPEKSQISRESPKFCSTNQQCSLINLPKHAYKHVWSHSPDLHAVTATQKARTNMFKPRHDLSKLTRPPAITQDVQEKKSDISQKKERVFGNLHGNKKSYPDTGTWKSRRAYLRHQNRHGKLTIAEAKDYKRTVKDPQEAYNKRRREQRKAEKKERNQSADH